MNNFEYLKEKEDIKILICHIFANIDIPLTKDIVIFCLQNAKIANFFELNSSFSDLLNNGILDSDSKNIIHITEKGLLVLDSLSESISQNIKNKAINKILEYIKMIKNINENDVKIEKISSGYLIKCSVSGGAFDLMNLSVFAPDAESALNIKRNFYKNLEEIYSGVLSKLIFTDDKLENNNSEFII